MKKEFYPFIGMIICLIMILISFFVPWYNYHFVTLSNSSLNIMDVNNYLTEITVNKDGITQTLSMRYSDLYQNNPTLPLYIFNVAYYLTIGCLIFALLVVIFLLSDFLIHRKINLIQKNRTIFCILTVIFSFITVFSFAILYHIETQKYLSLFTEKLSIDMNSIGFWTSLIVGDVSINSGPSIGWYIIIVAGFIALISLFLIPKKHEKNSNIIPITDPFLKKLFVIFYLTSS